MWFILFDKKLTLVILLIVEIDNRLNEESSAQFPFLRTLQSKQINSEYLVSSFRQKNKTVDSKDMPSYLYFFY